MGLSASEINGTFDILSIAPELKRKGAYWIGPCPVCRDGKDRFNARQYPNGWRWICRKCASDKYYTPIDLIMKRDGLTFRQALESLGGDVTIPSAPPRPAVIPQPQHAPNQKWQDAAEAIMHKSIELLWSKAGEKARAYLMGPQRLLTESMLKTWLVGYNPTDLFLPLKDWGIDPNSTVSKCVWIPRGIVIPNNEMGQMWSLKIRTPFDGKKYMQKYILVRGSQPAPLGITTCLGTQLAIDCEGEFDLMHLWSACARNAQDVGVYSMGAAKTRVCSVTWGWALLRMNHILVVRDQDEAGEQGAEMMRQLSGRVRVARTPVLRDGDNDITNYVQAGGDLTAWVQYQVAALR